MQSYLTLLKNVRDNGIVKVSAPRGLRTVPITTRSLFCQTIRHDMSLGFPLLTTKDMNFKAILAELLWFLSGDPSIKELKKYTSIWNAWADDEDRIPSAYGVRWREFGNNTFLRHLDVANCFNQHGFYDSEHKALIDDLVRSSGSADQIRGVLDLLTKDPSSRRGVVVAWDARVDLKSNLPPCHWTWVINILNDKLNLHVSMRSTDIPVGLPFNIASYAILLQLFAQWLHVDCGELAITCVDAHIYEDQLSGVEEQLTRTPGPLPTLFIPVGITLEDCNLGAMGLFDLQDYHHQGKIKFPVAL